MVTFAASSAARQETHVRFPGRLDTLKRPGEVATRGEQRIEEGPKTAQAGIHKAKLRLGLIYE